MSSDEQLLLHLQAPDAHTFDEVMVVAYKHRLQFFRLALLTPSYWPLTCAHHPCTITLDCR